MTYGKWTRAYRRALRQGLGPEAAALHAAAFNDDPVMHYRDGPYTALCGIHRPEDMLTEDKAAVTCGRCRRRVVFPGLLPDVGAPRGRDALPPQAPCPCCGAPEPIADPCDCDWRGETIVRCRTHQPTYDALLKEVDRLRTALQHYSDVPDEGSAKEEYWHLGAGVWEVYEDEPWRVAYMALRGEA